MAGPVARRGRRPFASPMRRSAYVLLHILGEARASRARGHRWRMRDTRAMARAAAMRSGDVIDARRRDHRREGSGGSGGGANYGDKAVAAASIRSCVDRSCRPAPSLPKLPPGWPTGRAKAHLPDEVALRIARFSALPNLAITDRGSPRPRSAIWTALPPRAPSLVARAIVELLIPRVETLAYGSMSPACSASISLRDRRRLGRSREAAADISSPRSSLAMVSPPR